jgi:hypothetical protein
LKEEALDLEQSEVAAKTRESGERAKHKMELPLTEVGATNFG